MVAATCYVWLLENKNRANKKEGSRNESNLEFVLPVMNIRRGKMWKQRQAAWLFHHAGLDAASLIFSNEVFASSIRPLFCENAPFCFYICINRVHS